MLYIARFIVFTLLSLLLAGCDDKPINQVLKIGTSADYPPFEFYENGKIVGFDIDIIKTIAERLDIQIEIKDMPFESLIMALKTGKIDAVASSMSYSAERSYNVSFSKPYYETKMALLCSNEENCRLLVGAIKGNGISPDAPLAIGAQTGSAMEQILQNTAEGVSIRSLSNNNVLVEEMRLGRIYGVALEEIQAMKYNKVHPGTYVQILDEYNNSITGSYSIVFAKNSPLIDKFNAVISDLHNDGTIDRLKQKWLVSHNSP